MYKYLCYHQHSSGGKIIQIYFFELISFLHLAYKSVFASISRYFLHYIWGFLHNLCLVYSWVFYFNINAFLYTPWVLLIHWYLREFEAILYTIYGFLHSSGAFIQYRVLLQIIFSSNWHRIYTNCVLLWTNITSIWDTNWVSLLNQYFFKIWPF